MLLMEAAASLYLALVLLAVLAVVLMWGTYLEHTFGEAAAKFGIYGAWWFTVLLASLAANISFAVAIRIPWSWRQIGFALAHVGVLVLLAGCMVTRRGSVSAMLPVFEHRSAGLAFRDSQHFELTVQPSPPPPLSPSPAPSPIVIPFRPGPFNWDYYAHLPAFPWALSSRDQGVLYDRDGVRLEVLDYYSNSRPVAIPRIVLQAASATASKDGGRESIELSVQSAAGPHGFGGRYGMGSQHALAGGQQVWFWMTGSAEETAAFQHSGPDGAVDKEGRIVLYTGGKSYQWPVDGWKPGERRPLGTTGLEVEFLESQSQFHAVRLLIRHGKDESHRMFLSSEFPAFNQHDYADGVFGTYWHETKPPAEKDKSTTHAGMTHVAGQPRIEILQGADQKLYIRTWRGTKLTPAVELPADGTALVALQGTPDAVALAVEQFIPSPKPASLPDPMPFDKMPTSLSSRQVLVRLTVDGKEDEFWLGTTAENMLEKMSGAPPSNIERVVQGKDRQVEVILRQDVLDLGVDVRLLRFRRVLDAGTQNPAHFISRVDLLPREYEDAPSRPFQAVEDASIWMNHPLDFTNPETGRSYRLFQAEFRGPFTAQQAGLEPNEADEELIYATVLEVATDPGRALKYIGCVMIVGGMLIHYLTRRKSRDRGAGLPPASEQVTRNAGASSTPAIIVGTLLFAFFGLAGTALADDNRREAAAPDRRGSPDPADSSGLDWTSWQQLPVFDNGRIMPLDTFARTTMKQICGTESPRLGARKFDPAELLFAWLADSEKWEHVPFIRVDDEYLRHVILQLPVEDGNGNRLIYASPQQIFRSERFRDRLEQLGKWQEQSQKDGQTAQLAGFDEKVEMLYQAYSLYRQLTSTPQKPITGRTRFVEKMSAAVQAWKAVEDQLIRLPLKGEGASPAQLAQQMAEMVRKLSALESQEEPSLEVLERLTASLESGADGLSSQLADLQKKARDPQPASAAADPGSMRAALDMLAGRMAEVARLVRQAHLALYDFGLSVRVLPSMDPSALEADRYRSDAPPWLSFQAVLFAPESTLRAYPPVRLQEARQAFQEAVAAYQALGQVANPSHDASEIGPASADFTAAMNRFTSAMRGMGEGVEADRRALPIREREQEVMDGTAYPPPATIKAEVFYNHVDPFLWAWILCAAALTSLTFSFGPLLRPMFWTGIAGLVATSVLIVAAFVLRAYITGWVSITSMFDTIVFVGLCVAVLGTGLTLLPWRKKRTRDTQPEAYRYECYDRRLVAWVGSLVALSSLLSAYFVPTFHREIELVRAVLRSNFWLAIHVKTIVSSYGVAAMAWGLGMISLGWYLFGSYSGRSEPAVCTTLGKLIYRLLQVTALLLASGTMLGAMWADVSWGRFWGWDPKEVWALISLLVYMLILHARNVGWSSPFVMATGASLGGLFILWTWYGVNFLMQGGKHSYGQGAGGQWAIFIFFAFCGIFIAAAAIRYTTAQNETSDSA